MDNGKWDGAESVRIGELPYCELRQTLCRALCHLSVVLRNGGLGKPSFTSGCADEMSAEGCFVQLTD